MTRLTERNLEAFLAGELYSLQEGDALQSVAGFLGLVDNAAASKVSRAVVAIREGVPAEVVSRHLDWKDFEGFCASLMAAKGFDVTRDLRLKKPRAQIDILARSPSIALIVDCKHWARERGPAGLSAVVEKQKNRALLLRKRMECLEPMAVVVLSLAEERARYVDGAAVVPVRTLGDFLDNVSGYSDGLSFY